MGLNPGNSLCLLHEGRIVATVRRFGNSTEVVLLAITFLTSMLLFQYSHMSEIHLGFIPNMFCVSIKL